MGRRVESRTNRKGFLSGDIGLDLSIIGLLCVGVALATWPLWRIGVSSDADMLMAVYRVFELEEAWKNWILFPRIGINLNYGYGAPLFQFYPPLASFGAMLFRQLGLGLIDAVKAMVVVNYLLAGVGMYFYGRWFFRSRPAAFVSAAAYVFSPYLILLVYERGALSESLALGLLPWLFYSFHRLAAEGRGAYFWSAALFAALIMLAHNITALFALPAALLFVLLLALLERRTDNLLLVFGAFALGMMMSAFFWLPALAELQHAKTDTYMLGRGLGVQDHLVGRLDWLQTSVWPDYWGDERFRITLWPVLLGAPAIVAIFYCRPSRIFRPLLILILYVLLIIVAQLGVTDSLWLNLPLVQYIQFPWRLFGIASMCLALLIGSALTLIPDKKGLPWAVAGGIGLSIFVLSLWNLKPAMSPLWYEIEEAEIGLADLFRRGSMGFPLFSDYSPSTMLDDSVGLARPRTVTPEMQAENQTPPGLNVIKEGPFRVDLDVDAADPFTLRLHRAFFPGWHAYVDNQRVAVTASGSAGVVTAELPAGIYSLRFQFEATRLRHLANWISIIGWVIFVVGMITLLPNRRLQWAVAILVILGVLAAPLVRDVGRTSVVRRPASFQANLEDEIRLLGYQIPKQRWSPGEQIPLRLYWLAQKTPSDNYSAFIHIAKLDDSGRVSQTDSPPMLGYSPTTHWEAGEIVTDQYFIQIDPETPPGRYLLLTGLYRTDPVGNLRVSDATSVLPGDRLQLTEIEVADE